MPISTSNAMGTFSFYLSYSGGLSRGGLLVPEKPGGGHNDYAGHVFWDMDTWMMPSIMLLHPDMGRQMITSRTRVLEQVKQNSIEAGYKGAKFPWEQATTGKTVNSCFKLSASRNKIAADDLEEFFYGFYKSFSTRFIFLSNPFSLS